MEQKQSSNRLLGVVKRETTAISTLGSGLIFLAMKETVSYIGS